MAITFRDELLLGSSINEKKLNRIKKKLIHRPMFCGYYLLSFSKNTSDQIDIYPAKMLAQKYYKENPQYIIGITKDYNEAVQLIQTIAEDCFRKTGNCYLKEFLQ